MKIKNKKNKNKILKIVALVIFILGLFLVGFWLVYNKNQTTSEIKQEARNETERNEDGVSVERNEDDIARSEEIAKNPDIKLQQSGSDIPNVSSENTIVNVVLTSAGIEGDNVDASGFVSNIFQDGGTCRYVFSNGSKTIIKESLPMPNASSTTCTTIRFPKSELSSGIWNVYLEYQKDSLKGKSANNMEIKI